MSTFFTVDDYLQPEWAAPPMHKYYFEVIKDGCLLGKLDIRQKPFNLVGRLDDLCDVVIDNPTVSRKHAIIQAKKDDPSLYLYDLGSAHGTFVNKEKLPMRTFKKLCPFDNIKFGVSSRVFVLRSPQYEQAQQDEQSARENKFSDLIQQQHRQLSKEELKQRYMDMLENDPYFHANAASRTLQGRQEVVEDEYEGIDWGITDQREVYAYKNESDLPIEPDVLRRLNLNETQLTKLAEYQDRFKKYQQIEDELNELTGREKRQFGLEEKLQGKKQKLEKKFVEALEAVQKSEDWLRVNIFGETIERDRKTVKIREKQNDTFGDDEYLDRTLEKKVEAKPEVETSSLSTEDYWRLQKQLKDNLKNLEESKRKLKSLEEVSGPIAIQGEQEDELEAFMKDNNYALDNENITILQRQIQQLEQNIESIKNKFKTILGEQEINKIQPSAADMTDQTIKELYHQRSIQENLISAKQRMEQQHTIEQILGRLQNAQQEEEELNEMDPAIFKYYKGGPQDDDEQDDLDQQKLTSKLRYERQYNPNKFEKPIAKHPRLETPKIQAKVEQEQAVDLTKLG